MTITAVEAPTADLVDVLEAQSITARYTCPACGRIKCRCGRTPAEPPKATISTDLTEDEHALSSDEWAELNGYEPRSDTLSAGSPWFSDVAPVLDEWPWGAPVIPVTPGYAADPGRPNHEERICLEPADPAYRVASWYRRTMDRARVETSHVRTISGIYDVTRQGAWFRCSCGVERCSHVGHVLAALEDVV